MILVIAEKPSVGAAIGKVLGASSRKDGYLEGNNYIVSWCVGHLVGLADASSYDERFAKWRYSDLPIVPEDWLFEVPKDKQEQSKMLCDLMRDKRVSELVCATDAGREGEPIFRLVYNKAGCMKPFKRLWISSVGPPWRLCKLSAPSLGTDPPNSSRPSPGTIAVSFLTWQNWKSGGWACLSLTHTSHENVPKMNGTVVCSVHPSTRACLLNDTATKMPSPPLTN